MTTNHKSSLVVAIAFFCLATLSFISFFQTVQVDALSFAVTNNFFVTQRTFVPNRGYVNLLDEDWITYDAFNQNFVDSTHIRGLTDYDDGLSVGILKQIEADPALQGLYYTREDINAHSNRSYDLYMELYNGFTHAESITPNPQSSTDIEAFRKKEKRFDQEKSANPANIDVYAFQFNYPFIFPAQHRQAYSDIFRSRVNYDKPVYDGIEFTYTYYGVFNNDTNTFSGWTSPDKTWLAYPIDKTMSFQNLNATMQDSGATLELDYNPITRTAQINGSITSNTCFEAASFKGLEPVLGENGTLKKVDFVIESSPVIDSSPDCLSKPTTQEATQIVQWRFEQEDLTKFQELGFVNASSLVEFFGNPQNFGVRRTGSISIPDAPIPQLGELDLRTFLISASCSSSTNVNGETSFGCSSSYTPQGFDFVVLPLINTPDQTIAYNANADFENVVYRNQTDSDGVATVLLSEGEYTVLLKYKDTYYCHQVRDTKACSVTINPSQVTLAAFEVDTAKT